PRRTNGAGGDSARLASVATARTAHSSSGSRGPTTHCGAHALAAQQSVPSAYGTWRELMTMWLYQMDQRQWSPNSYRVDIWENERWSWPVGRKASAGAPRAGDRIVFFYAPRDCIEPGFYGW